MTTMGILQFISSVILIVCAFYMCVPGEPRRYFWAGFTALILSAFVVVSAVIWPKYADEILYPEAEIVFTIPGKTEKDTTSLKREVESGKYYIVQEDLNNLFYPTYRVYLPENMAQEYISQYNNMENTKTNLVTDLQNINGDR